MALLTPTQELAAVREAIQTLSGGGTSVANVEIAGMTLTYHANQKDFLVKREAILAGQVTVRNVRKRTAPDFTD